MIVTKRDQSRTGVGSSHRGQPHQFGISGPDHCRDFVACCLASSRDQPTALLTALIAIRIYLDRQLGIESILIEAVRTGSGMSENCNIAATMPNLASGFLRTRTVLTPLC